MVKKLIPNDEDSSEHKGKQPGHRGNDLDGTAWIRYSISVWNDIRKSPAEVKFGHPAMFPSMLVERLIDCFTTHEGNVILDPFLGSGSTVVAAEQRQKIGIGLEISDEYIKLAKQRLKQGGLFVNGMDHRIIKADARSVEKHVDANSVDLCVTSPPYWDILTQKRSADGKAQRDYGDTIDDLGKIGDYEQFLVELTKVFDGVLKVLKPGKYCIVNVMDLRKKEKFFPLHSDLARRMAESGWIYDDVIIWDRRQEYNNLRPLGFPFVFRINKIHEYLLIFKKPNDPGPVGNQVQAGIIPGHTIERKEGRRRHGKSIIRADTGGSG